MIKKFSRDNIRTQVWFRWTLANVRWPTVICSPVSSFQIIQGVSKSRSDWKLHFIYSIWWFYSQSDSVKKFMLKTVQSDFKLKFEEIIIVFEILCQMSTCACFFPPYFSCPFVGFLICLYFCLFFFYCLRSFTESSGRFLRSFSQRNF